MNTLVIVSEEENEEMLDLIEEINAVKVLARTLEMNNEVYYENSDFYQQMKKDLISNAQIYQKKWAMLIKKYNLDPKKVDHYMLDFSNRSITYNPSELDG